MITIFYSPPKFLRISIFYLCPSHCQTLSSSNTGPSLLIYCVSLDRTESNLVTSDVPRDTRHVSRDPVLDNSRVTVDGVDVSLRLWDTFGDHHKVHTTSFDLE